MKNYRQLFPDLEEGLRDQLNEKGRVLQVEAGKVLLQTGQNIRNTILVLEGLVKLYREDEDGNEFFMYHLRPGDACALSMICDRSHRTSAVTAKADTDTVLLVVSVDHTESWMREYRSWYHFVVSTYRRRYEELLETIDSIAFKNLDERLEFYLRRHRDTLKSNVLELTNTEIAQELNSSREVISRLMKKLSEAGKIRLLKNGIEILKL
ncbi:MAG: Crp/Fnr family transcriptional regulator [Saprospirales bacterium]|nr:Crp/Fnr family transcriptional regulator [Saprospirales bacterium]